MSTLLKKGLHVVRTKTDFCWTVQCMSTVCVIRQPEWAADRGTFGQQHLVGAAAAAAAAAGAATDAAKA
jgi:hypothetical protein